MKRHFLTAMLLAASLCLQLALSSCAILNPGPPPTRIQLKPRLAQTMSYGMPKGQIIVASPIAGREVDTDRIALVFNGREVRYLADARWTGTAPQLLQRSTIDALEASGAFRGVSDETGGLLADARLTADLRDFALHYADEKSAPTARFEGTFRLLDLRSGNMLATRNFTASAMAGGTTDAALAAAAEEALGKALSELTPWVIANMPAESR